MAASDRPRMENRAYYDRFSETYEERRHGGYHLLVDELQSGLVLPFAQDRDVLEVGCGTGLILDRVRRVARTAVGMDLSAGMAARARDRGLDVTLGEATSLPFPDGRFDVCYSFKVLSHVPDLRRALSELARVTRPGGRIFAEFYNKHSSRYLIRRLRGGARVVKGIDDNQVFFRFYRPAEVEALLPPGVVVERTHGVRLFTVMPSMVSWPVVGRGLSWAERRFMSSPLGRFGGFLVLECTKL